MREGRIPRGEAEDMLETAAGVPGISDTPEVGRTIRNAFQRGGVP